MISDSLRIGRGAWKEVKKMGYSSFKLESLYLDLKEKRLTINGKEIPLDGITDFDLTMQGASWHISGKRDITFEVCEKHDHQDSVNAVFEEHSVSCRTEELDKTGTEGFQEASRILRFNKEQEEKGQAILKILEEMSVEEGVSLLEKCIFQHSYFGWERGYMKESAPYGIKGKGQE